MRRIAIAGLAAVACIGQAHAQSNVTLYGSLDDGIAYTSNVGGKSKYYIDSGEMQPDRWGLRGNEDLGGGNKAVFWLENGFSTNTGAALIPSDAWSRIAYVGLSSEHLGTVTLGMQTPFSSDYLLPFSTSYLNGQFMALHPGNLDELANTGPVPYDNSIKYVSPTLYGFTGGAILALGNTTNFAHGRNLSFGLNYAMGNFRAAVAYQVEHNRSPAIAATDFTTFQGMPAPTYQVDKFQEFGAGASYRLFGRLTLHGLFTWLKLQTNGQVATWNAYDAGANYDVTHFDTIGIGGSTTELAGRRYTQLNLNNVYLLSKSTQLYINTYYEHASGNGARAALFTAGVSSGRDQFAIRMGIHHSF
ncbi:MAG TPA: porin [Paraburkholderia sp.]